MTTSSNCYSSLYPFPFDLNEDAEREPQQFQEQEDQVKTYVPHDGSVESENELKLSIIRVCADCNTTKTPLWRGGPKGPKSLCNACGIRQRKARRAMAAAAVSEVNGSVVGAEPSMKTSKVPVPRKAKGVKHKKCKLSCQFKGRKKLCFEDLRKLLSKNSAFRRVFPQDEKEAALLLMALSYGLVHG